MALDSYPAPDQRLLISRFFQDALGFWRGRSAWRAWSLVLLMISVVLLQLFVQYRLNYWNRYFFDAIERRDRAEIIVQMSAFLPIAASSIVLATLSVWGRMTTQRKWREWLSKRLYGYWLEKGHSRQLRFMEGEHQNPEYRIAEDARLATDLPIDLVLGLFTSIITAITFVGVLWHVGGTLFIGALDLTIRGYLVFAVVLYSLGITAAMMIIGRHLTRVLAENKRAEAQLRAIGSDLRERGEHAARPGDEGDGRKVIDSALTDVIKQWIALCWQIMRMTVVSQANVLLAPVIGLLLCMPNYLSGTMSLGEVVQATAAFVIVQSAFNWITESYGRLAEWTSSANRVASLLLALDQIDEPHGAEGGSAPAEDSRGLTSRG